VHLAVKQRKTANVSLLFCSAEPTIAHDFRRRGHIARCKFLAKTATEKPATTLANYFFKNGHLSKFAKTSVKRVTMGSAHLTGDSGPTAPTVRCEAREFLAQAPPQRGGWQLAIERAIIAGKTPKAEKAVSPRHLGDAGHIRTSAAQDSIDLLHCAKTAVGAGTDAQARNRKGR